jgi:abequosyltransferase
MRPLLTVAMPTYRRAALIDAQLAWFARAVEGQENRVELLVSDNCSPDETAAVCERWRQALAGGGLRTRFHRQERNVGAIRNIAWCMREAAGTYVWVVGDDDTIDPAALRFVTDTIEQHPDLALLILNYASRHWKTGELRFERCFEVQADQLATDGQALVERFLHDDRPSRWGGLVLTTALVYRTAPAQAALAAWEDGLDNISLQLFITAFVAQQGTTMLTSRPHLEMAAGRHFFAEDPLVLYRFRIGDIPEAFVRLARIGYARELCLHRIRHQRRELSWRRLMRLFARHPVATAAVLARHASATLALSRAQDARRRRAARTGAARPDATT